jgi:hypothetical protein
MQIYAIRKEGKPIDSVGNAGKKRGYISSIGNTDRREAI